MKQKPLPARVTTRQMAVTVSDGVMWYSCVTPETSHGLWFACTDMCITPISTPSTPYTVLQDSERPRSNTKAPMILCLKHLPPPPPPPSLPPPPTLPPPPSLSKSFLPQTELAHFTFSLAFFFFFFFFFSLFARQSAQNQSMSSPGSCSIPTQPLQDSTEQIMYVLHVLPYGKTHVGCGVTHCELESST